MSDAIRFDDVHRRFGAKPVLSGLSFGVRPGEIYALLGRNGAGKTTALSILLGFLQPMSGKSSILGTASDALTPDVRLKVGLVTEGHRMYSWMKVRQAIEFEAGTRANFDRSYAEAALERLRISPKQWIFRLSRGQLAQLSLVFALAGDPEVLVLDDPAMGLDPVMRREFLGAMIELLGREGRSVLFSSHILADVERVADRIGILHGGRLIVDARLDEIKERVQKRFVQTALEPDELARHVPGVLRARRVRNGIDLTLLDVGPEREAALQEACNATSDPSAPTLEELFIELTGQEALPPMTPSARGAA